MGNDLKQTKFELFEFNYNFILDWLIRKETLNWSGTFVGTLSFGVFLHSFAFFSKRIWEFSRCSCQNSSFLNETLESIVYIPFSSGGEL